MPISIVGDSKINYMDVFMNSSTTDNSQLGVYRQMCLSNLWPLAMTAFFTAEEFYLLHQGILAPLQ